MTAKQIRKDCKKYCTMKCDPTCIKSKLLRELDLKGGRK